MKASFYTEEEASLFERKSKVSLILAILFLAFAVIAFTLSILLSSYETKLLWMIFGCFLSLVPCCLSFLFFMQRKHRLDGLYLYRQILNEEGESYEGTILSIKDYPITLANSFEVYEIEVELAPEEKKIFYVSSDKRKAFDFEIGKRYRFLIVSLYIKEIENA